MKKMIRKVIGIVFICQLLSGYNKIFYEKRSEFLDQIENKKQQVINEQSEALKEGDISKAKVKVDFIDVGQGDCILICDGDKNMMIDTGTDGFSNIKSVLREEKVKNIDILVLTHPDADHIANAEDIIKKYDVGRVYMPNVAADTWTYRNLQECLVKENIEVHYPLAGDMISLGGQATYEVVGPVSYSEDTNSSSLVIKMKNGNDSFLFTGDATGPELETSLANGFDLSCNVYKAAHHGSANDGCNEPYVLNAADPDYMVVSCAYAGEYGHPHIETMQLAKDKNLKLYRTDMQGTIKCESTKDGILFEMDPTDDFRNGNALK